MLDNATISFLKALKKNNDKEWFDANRAKYEAAKQNFEALVAEVLKEIGKFDSSTQHLQPKECTFRINRDVRFSKNKAPYKTNMAMYISRGGKKDFASAGYYFHLEPGASFIGGGMWMPMAAELKKVRQEIDYNFKEFHKILNGGTFKKVYGDLSREEGAVLSRPPKGYEPDNPAIEYLKFKSFVASAPVTDKLLVDPQLPKTIGSHAKALFPLVQFLNRAVDTGE